MIHFKDITKHNRQEVLKLAVDSSQESFIESVAECLKEADEYPAWRPKAIYADEILVGFMMYGMFERVWFDRLLIDKRYQGKGYGTKVVSEALKMLRTEYGQKEIYLSAYPDNHKALKLYERFGFVKTGELDTKGEQIMVHRD